MCVAFGCECGCVWRSGVSVGVCGRGLVVGWGGASRLKSRTVNVQADHTGLLWGDSKGVINFPWIF